MADKPIGKDATGYEILTDAMKALLNQYPGLYENETILPVTAIEMSFLPITFKRLCRLATISN